MHRRLLRQIRLLHVHRRLLRVQRRLLRVQRRLRRRVQRGLRRVVQRGLLGVQRRLHRRREVVQRRLRRQRVQRRLRVRRLHVQRRHGGARRARRGPRAGRGLQLARARLLDDQRAPALQQAALRAQRRRHQPDALLRQPLPVCAHHRLRADQRLLVLHAGALQPELHGPRHRLLLHLGRLRHAPARLEHRLPGDLLLVDDRLLRELRVQLPLFRLVLLKWSRLESV